MRVIFYDFEVFSDDWLVVFKDYDTKGYAVIHNNNEILQEYLSDDYVYVGFNTKHYDQHIMKACYDGFSPREVKELNDFIVAGGNGWEYPPLSNVYFRFNNVDIRDDMQQNLSLKSIEGHLGMNIKESPVPFDIDRPLTEEELEEAIKYCMYDVDSTEAIFDLRVDYLKNKIEVGKLINLDDVKSLSMTNAKLTATLLGATPKEHKDERDYVYPENLRSEYIPREVFQFFDRRFNPEISDDKLFHGSIEFSIGDCPITVGYGGIHGAIPNFISESRDGKTIRNFDVGSYYPHLMKHYGYTSRNIPSPKVFEDVLADRMRAKAEGDKVKANALKLVCNTTYGAMLHSYNPLYDPMMGRSVCITGQLFLLELASHLHRAVEGLRIVQLNTDGVMVEFDKQHIDRVRNITKEWEERTKFELEEDVIKKIVQKDVNNYIEIQEDGSTKCKGGYLVRGVTTAGAFNINNNARIVSTALKEYFVNGVSVEETINNCNELSEYQLIANAGSKYKCAYHIVDGEKVEVQKVNRVYASANNQLGTLYKVKREDGHSAKIENLPEHCVIDNENKLGIEAVDKSFYIELAQKRINDFLGVKPEGKTRRAKRMGNSKKSENGALNVYQKLLKARLMFLEAEAKKTGMNPHLTFMYFELKDIVPIATKIFNEIGLIPIVNINETVASMTMINAENPEETIVFETPFHQIQPILSGGGKQVTNEMMALGSSITYIRRYLYLIVLDISENDEIDANAGKPEGKVETPVVKPTPPATPQERKEVKVNLTAPEEPATKLQIKGLKGVLKKLMEVDPTEHSNVVKLAINTEEFATLSKSECEKLIQEMTAKLESVNGKTD